MPTLKYVLFLTLLLLTGMPLGTSAMEGEDMFKNVSLENGLSNLSASDFCMDSDGQMWISSFRGLCLYNGQYITFFQPSGVPKRDMVCHHVDVNSRGDVYVAGRGGLFVLPFGEKQLKRVVNNMVLDAKTSGNHVYYGDKEGLHLLDEKGHSTLLYKCTLEDLSVRSIRVVGQKVWFAVSRHLGCYDIKTQKKNLYKVLSTSSLTDLDVFKNKIYLGTKSDGLVLFDAVSHRQQSVSAVLGKIICGVKLCGKDICVATDGFGAYVLDGNTGNVKEHYSMFEKGKFHLPDNTIYSFLRDRHGVDWFGVFYYGILHDYYSQPVFSVYSGEDFTTKDKSVCCFLNDNGLFLLGTRSGLYWKKPGKGDLQLASFPNMSSLIVTDVIKFEGKYYVSTYDNGLLTLNLSSGALEHVRGNEYFKNSTFYNMKKGPDGNLWITGSEGVFVIYPNGAVKLILVQDKKTRRMPMQGIEFDCNGKGWVGTSNSVILIDSHTYRVENFKGDMKPFVGTSANKVAKGHNGQMLVFSSDSLKIYDANSLQHKDMELPGMIVGENCRAVYDDQNGHYYIANDKDLYRTNYNLDDILSLGAMHNLNANYISSTGVFIRDDKIWVCSGNGLYYASLSSLDKNTVNETHFPIIPYRLSTGGILAGTGYERKVLREKTLYTTWNFTQASISFLPVYGDFARQEQRVYEYRTDDHKWIATKEPYVEVRGLLPGKHQLTVRLLGIPSSETVFTVWVTPSFLFWIELTFLLLSISAGLYFRSYRRKTKTLLNERDFMEQALIEVEEVQNKAEEIQNEIPAEKKKMLKVNRDEMEKLYRRVDEFMQTEKPYLSSDMRLSDVSAAMGVSNTVLSNMFKYYLEESYYDYVNGYRLKEFKRYLEEKAYKQYTIIALSEKCGFKKSSFFTTFRKMEGMTPTEYLQKHT